MAIEFNPDGSIVTSGDINFWNTFNLAFHPNYDITTPRLYLDDSLSTPYFDANKNIHCKKIIASNYRCYNDIIYGEEPYGDFPTQTVNGWGNSGATYIDASKGNDVIYACSYLYNNGGSVNWANRGSVPSNNVLWSKITNGAGSYYIITNTNINTGVSIGGTVYNNSSRGSYKINRVGLYLTGGCGGGSRSEFEGSTGDWYGGAGGGGGASVIVVLKLDYNDYRIYIGEGGAGGAAQSSNTAAAGTASFLQYKPKDGSTWTTIITCGGGGAGGVQHNTRFTGGAGGTVTFTSGYSSKYILVNSESGGAGGYGAYGNRNGTIYSPNTAGTKVETFGGYFQGYSDVSSAYVSYTGSTKTTTTSAAKGTGGGMYSARTTYYTGGDGGSKPSDPGGTTTINYNAGSNGHQGIAYIYY